MHIITIDIKEAVLEIHQVYKKVLRKKREERNVIKIQDQK